MTSKKDFVRSRYWYVGPTALVTGLTLSAVFAPAPAKPANIVDTVTANAAACDNIKINNVPGYTPIVRTPTIDQINGQPACAVSLSEGFALVVDVKPDNKGTTELNYAALAAAVHNPAGPQRAN